MKKILLLLGLLPLCAYGQIITTFAGNGTTTYPGDGVPATSVGIIQPGGIVFDPAGNAYISDFGHNKIRKVNGAGIISTYAGNGLPGYSGDGGPASAASFDGPVNLALDAAGNLYVADLNNNAIRKVSPSGTVTTFAGDGTIGYGGDGGPATNAQLYKASGLAVDASNNVYIADYANNVIRKVNTAGIISTVAGTGAGGSTGDGGPATDATLFQAWGVCLDAAGNLYIAVASNHNIRKVNTSGIISTIAGTGTPGFSGDGSPATAAEFNNPPGVAVDATGNVYIADQFNNRVRKINSAGIVSTIAGTGVAGYNGDNIAATSAQLNLTNSLTFDHTGRLLIVDNDNNRIRAIQMCGHYFTLQPLNDTVPEGTNAIYTVATTMPAPSYQWQEDPGTGFVDLANVWPYSGVTTATLTIHNTSHYLNATHYRCVVTSEASPCADTSFGAILIVRNVAGLVSLGADNGLLLHPNPVHDELTINAAAANPKYSLRLCNAIGQLIVETTMTASPYSLDMRQLPAGIYLLQVTGAGGKHTYKVVKD